VTVVDELRAAELAFLDTGDEQHLGRAEALVDGALRRAPFADATRLWLSLQRYDLGGGDRWLDATACATTDDADHDPSLAAAAVAVLLRRWARDGEAADLDRAIGLAHAAGAGEPGSGDRRELPLWLSPAWRAIDLGAAYLERSRLDAAGADGDLLAARDAARRAVRLAPAPAIRALGLRYQACCDQELYVRHGARRLLEAGIRRYERALAMLSPRSVLRPMLLTELGTALQDRFAEDQDPADIDAAVSHAGQALAAAASMGASQPDLACHLVNLGTALNTRYEQTGDPHDLDGAVRRWTEAIGALPATSAYRPVFLDRLALGHAMRWEYGGGGDEDLDAAVSYGRAAISEGAGDPDAVVYASNLAGALEQRWELRRDPEDLHEAVRVFAAAMGSQPTGDPSTGGASTADLTVNFAHTLLARHQAFGGTRDLDAAVAALGRLPDEGLRGAQRSSVAAVSARGLAMRYEAAGDPADLAAAIAAGRRGLAGVAATSTTRNSRTARLAHLLYLRFARYGRRRDLDSAIGLLSDLIDTTDTTGAAIDRHEASPDQLSQLASYLSERYDRDGNPADRDAAIRFGRRARESDRRDAEPVVDSALAAVLHDRFGTAGWLDDLDEVIARYREALTRQAATAPVYPAILANLAIALQDRYLYRGDSGSLDEAIRLHEQAVSVCPPGAPDRPGYLGTLAVAVRLRFERDDREADLDHAISLSEQALASLDPGAPERGRQLGNLAQARHLRAAATGSPADFDDAISAYRTALRRIAGASPARPPVLSGYARALGEHPAAPSRAAVLRAFREALAATAGAPLVSFDVADSLARWAAGNQLWPQAAQAYQMAADARRTLFAAQVDRAYQDIWLARGTDISAAQAQAWIRSGQQRRAAAALETGRALALSEALDTRGAPSRLLAGNHRELADRYEQAVGLLRRVATTTNAVMRGSRESPTSRSG
jgi:tetratricopeptide (TPR) repeat protein